MFGINRLEAYGVGLVILLLALAGADFHGRHVQRQLDEERAAAALLVAQKRADDATTKSQQITEDSAQKIETLRSQHEAELAATRDSLAGRLCRPAPTHQPLPETGSAPTKPDAALAGGADAGSVTIDLPSFVEACQIDADTLMALQEWIRAQQAADR